MIPFDEINIRLEKLAEYLKLLKEYQGITAEELIADAKKRGVVERYLQLAAEVCIDVAEILISAKGLRTPEDARDAIDILGQEGIIDDEFAFGFAAIGGFRNILVHDYLKINYEIVTDKINNRLDDFEIFAKQIAGYVKKH